MKKILLAIAFVTMMAFGANAQRDGFFSSYDNGYGDRAGDINGLLILPNSDLGSNDNVSAPLGSGLVILTALGAGYAVARRRK